MSSAGCAGGGWSSITVTFTTDGFTRCAISANDGGPVEADAAGVRSERPPATRPRRIPSVPASANANASTARVMVSSIALRPERVGTRSRAGAVL